jgi:hypothetical protein
LKVKEGEGVRRVRDMGVALGGFLLWHSAGLAKAQREVAEYHRFRELSGQLLGVNERICAATG